MKLFVKAVLFFLLLLTGVFFGFRAFAGAIAGHLRISLSAYLFRETAARPQIGSIRVRLGYPVRFEIDGLRVRVGSADFLKAPKVSGTLSWPGIFSSTVRVRSCRVDFPRIEIHRDARGTWNWPVQKPVSGRPTRGTSGKPDSESARVWPVVVSGMEINHGTWTILDESTSPPFLVVFDDVRAKVILSPSIGIRDLTGTCRLNTLKNPAVEFSGSFNPARQAMTFSAAMWNKKIIVRGDVAFDGRQAQYQGDISMQQVSINDFFPGPGPVTGSLTVSAEGHASGGTMPDFLKNMQWRGGVDVRDGAVLTVNLPARFFDAISKLPGLADAGRPVMAAKDGEMWDRKDTPFEILQAGFQLSEGRLVSNDIVLKEARYMIDAEGTLGLRDHEVDLRGRLILRESAAAAVSAAVPRLKQLTNPQGRIVIPFMWQGNGASSLPAADLAYLENKLKPVSLAAGHLSNHSE